MTELHDAGRPEAHLYLADPDNGVGGAGAFFLLLDQPEVSLSMVSGAALMAASALTRFGVFEAGRASARTRSTPSGRNAGTSANRASQPADRFRPRTARLH